MPHPAVLLVPRWGADPLVPGGEAVDALNRLASSWRPLASFGSNDVLINAAYANPWGDPALSIAVVR